MSFLWTDRDVREALDLAPKESTSDLRYTEIATDSRHVEPGALFVALPGERFDGHDFVLDALARGASGAVVSREVPTEENTRLYPVPDTLEALGMLAAHRRRALDARIVGITGSSGKTTTKDLLNEALRGSLRVHATEGNLNNRIGLPLTLLAAPSRAEALILEMGTNEPGEIRALTRVAGPHIGVITTISESHLEGLGSLEGVLEEKLDLLRGLQGDGVGVVGDEPALLEERAREVVPDVVVTGLSDRVPEELRPRDPRVMENGCFRFRWKGETVSLRLPGRHSVLNALLALAVAHHLGVPAKDAARRVGRAEPWGMRSEIRNLGGLTLLVDCYNANPQSVKAALELLTTIQQLGPKVAVLGSMLELGEDTRILHREVLEAALTYPLDLLVATGLFAEAARWISPPPGSPELLLAPELDQARDVLLRSLGGAEVVLLKASRGVAMERLIPALGERFGAKRGA